MGTTTKRELVDRIAHTQKVKRSVARGIVQAFLDEITSELAKGNRLEFRDFGVFEVKQRRARTAQNPKTLEPVEVPPRWTVKFKAGRKMQDSVDGLPEVRVPEKIGISKRERQQTRESDED